MSKRGLKVPKQAKGVIIGLMGKIRQLWKEKDNGIWEIRLAPQHYTYSKVMAWVGVNRAIRMCKILGISPKVEESWRVLEKEIKAWIWENGFDPKLKSFKQHPNTQNQDATNLLFVLLQFLDKKDPLTKTIIENTCKELSRGRAFVYRYMRDDGLEGREGAFLLCSFWLISAWAILEEVGEAEGLFKIIEKYIDQSGLFSEEIDPTTGEYLGNFPQAFSHVGFIMSAYYLKKYRSRHQ